MRWLSLLGAFVFAYLAIIPAGLVIAIFDSACAGGDCQTSLARDIILGVIYVAAFVSVAGTSVIMAANFFRHGLRTERLMRFWLVASLATIGTTLFAHFALAFPLAATFTLGVGGMVYGTLRYMNRPPPAKSGDLPKLPDLPDDIAPPNGHGSANGHA